MTAAANNAPLHRDALRLCGVLMEELETGRGYTIMRERLLRGALRLLDDIALALADFDRPRRVANADAELTALRTQLRLAHELGLLDEEAFLALAEQCDKVGRQLGGWRRSLGRLS